MLPYVTGWLLHVQGDNSTARTMIMGLHEAHPVGSRMKVSGCSYIKAKYGCRFRVCSESMSCMPNQQHHHYKTNKGDLMQIFTGLYWGKCYWLSLTLTLNGLKLSQAVFNFIHDSGKNWGHHHHTESLMYINDHGQWTLSRPSECIFKDWP